MRSRLLLALALCCAVPALAETVERILAVVDGRPVLLSEVVLVGKLKGIGHAEALEALIDERLMFQEAVRLGQATPRDVEEKAYEELRQRAPSTGDELGLRRLARRQVAILRYVAFRFQPQVRVTDEAVRAEWERRFPEPRPSLDEVAAGLREELEARDLDARLEAWVKALRAGADVRMN